MSFAEIILIAIGLSMDAFAVSVTIGLSLRKPKTKEYIIPGLYFGIFQALMPFIGYCTGIFFANYIRDLDHWVAFVLLSLIGGKMIKESFSKEEEKQGENLFLCAKMLLLSIATSIDALAVGITLAFFETDIITAISIIGITTFLVSIIGVKVGHICGIKFRSKAEFFGGAVLIIIGFKILIEHMFF